MSGGIIVRDRRKAVLLLAGSVEDFGSWLYDPKGSGRNSTSGLGQRKRIDCPTCSKTPNKSIAAVPGLVFDKFGQESPCPMCTKPGKRKGAGRMWSDLTNDGNVVVQSADTAAPPTREPKTKRCQHCQGTGELPNKWFCPECKGVGRIPDLTSFVLADESPGEKDPMDAYLDAIKRRDASGSYREYLLLEAELRHRSPHLLRPFRALYVEVPRAKSLPAVELRNAEQAIRFFLEWLPGEVRVPGWVVKADEEAAASRSRVRGRGVSAVQRGKRDEEIIGRFRAGESVRVIAGSVGLSVQRVNEIVYQEREVA